MVGVQQFEVFVHHISDCHICPMSSFADFLGVVEYGPLQGKSFGTLESYLVLVGDLIGGLDFPYHSSMKKFRFRSR